MEAVGIEHPNQFEFGAQTIQPDHVQGKAAWFERMKGVRDEPQHVEQKAEYAREMSRLPGVTVSPVCAATCMCQADKISKVTLERVDG